MTAEVVRAAGGILWRDGGRGPEVLLVHRPKYDDWSLPKGKLGPGESLEDAALREVEEETGFRCRLGEQVGSVSYEDRHGRPKVSTYWAMTPMSGDFEPHEEVDEIRWLPVAEALDALSYVHDADLVAEWVGRRED